jgi:hypothetical protein
MRTTILPFAWLDSIARVPANFVELKDSEPVSLCRCQLPPYRRWLEEERPRLESPSAEDKAAKERE